MVKNKRSFFERLTGSVKIHNDDVLDDFENDFDTAEEVDEQDSWNEDTSEISEEIDENEGELTVDVFQKPDEIVVKAMVAGVKPDNLDVTVTRDMVTIKGTREGERTVDDGDYLFKELYWGTFSRTILLPEEVEADEAEANEKHGLLTVRIPKIDKGRQTKLKVKSH